MLAILPSIREQGERVISESILTSRYIRFTLNTWVPGLTKWEAIECTMPTNYNGQQPISTEVDDLDLPTAVRRWKVTMPRHPEITFDDLRAGEYPELTEEEIEARGKAMQAARFARAKLDIRPLTTAVIIRQVREGKSLRD